jgi:hypothetical protein
MGRLSLSWVQRKCKRRGEKTMGIFSRKPRSDSRQRVSANSSNDFIGRKFRSQATLSECLETYAAVSAECYRTAGSMYETEWHMPIVPAAFQPSQGTPPLVPPAKVVATDLIGGGRIYLAVWDGVVSYGGGVPTGGPPCEMWFVPPGFDTSPIPIAGTWKMRDSSLSSIGWVEGPMWGIS